MKLMDFSLWFHFQMLSAERLKRYSRNAGHQSGSRHE
jgi:hypothetical protein